MSYRDDIEALRQRCEALEHEVSTASRDLDEARHLLDDALARRRLPVLPNLRVAAPCAADWDRMEGDARVRFCGQCQKNVYNLSEMTRVEAEDLIFATEGRLCVRYYQRADGTVLTADCPSGVRRRRRRRRVLLAAFGAAGAVAALGTHRMSVPVMGAVAPRYVQHAPSPADDPSIAEPVMGEVELARPAPPRSVR